MQKTVEITPKKPILAYVGMEKKTLVEAVPTQVIEIVYPSKAEEITKELLPNTTQESMWGARQIGLPVTEYKKGIPQNRLIWTNDNLVALRTLLDEKDSISGEYKYRNKIDLIYIDPPFMVQDDFISQNSIDIHVNQDENVVSVKEPTIIETIAYKDTWQNGLDSFLQMMCDRLLLLKELLAPTGTIYVHLDWHAVHYVKILMDEIFDYMNFRNEIIWQKLTAAKAQSKTYPNIHDTILFYSNTPENYFNTQYTEKSERLLETHYRYTDEKTGKRYSLADFTQKGQGVPKKFGNKLLAPPPGKHWIWSQERIDQGIKDGLIIFTESGLPYVKRFYEDTKGNVVEDIWIDIFPVNPVAKERTGYPTQKPVELLKRIIRASCPNHGLVLDAFVGSGTTCEAAEELSKELGCSWIGIDNSKFAIHTTRKRLIELNGKPKENKSEGTYEVRPFTVENMGYYQRNAVWDPLQINKEADAYRQAIVELFGGEYFSYSKLLHGKKHGSWIHVGPLSNPIVFEQMKAIAEEAKDTEFKKVYVLSADYTAHYEADIQKIKRELGVQLMIRLIPSSAIEEIKRRLQAIKDKSKKPEDYISTSNIAFFSPLTINVNKAVDGKEVMVELARCEVDTDSFLDSQKPERREELGKWLKTEKSWKSFVDFWAVDWDYENLKDELKEPIFENEWQSFTNRNSNKVVEDIVFTAFHTYDKPGKYQIAVKVTDVFGNDGITTLEVEIK